MTPVRIYAHSISMSDDKLKKALSDLVISLHTEYSNIACSSLDETERSPPLSSILALSPLQTVQFLKEKLEKLLEFRRVFSGQKQIDDAFSMQKYEKSLQKLESEVRNHFSIQQQLRLHIESIQANYDEELRRKEEIIAGLQRKVDGLAGEKHGKHHATDRDETPSRLETSADRSFEQISAIKDVLNLRATVQGESERIKKLNRKIMKLESLIRRMKDAYMAKDAALKELQSKFTAYSTARSTIIKYELLEPPSRVRFACRDPAEKSSSRERALTPIPNTLTTSRTPSKVLLRSNSNERKRMKIKLSMRKIEGGAGGRRA